MRHLRALPLLPGLWQTWPEEGEGRWIVPADDEARATGVLYLALKEGDPTHELKEVC